MQESGGSSARLILSAAADFTRIVDQLLLEHLAPAAIVISENFVVLEVRGKLPRLGFRATVGHRLGGRIGGRLRALLGPEPATLELETIRCTVKPVPGGASSDA